MLPIVRVLACAAAGEAEVEGLTELVDGVAGVVDGAEVVVEDVVPPQPLRARAPMIRTTIESNKNLFKTNFSF
jgi:hypothetical protein